MSPRPEDEMDDDNSAPSRDVQFGRRASDNHMERWHLGKEIPLAIIVMLAVQTLGGVWWLASLSFKIDSALSQLTEFRQDRYTKDDGRRDRELVMQVIEAQRQRDIDLDRRISSFENKPVLKAQ